MLRQPLRLCLSLAAAAGLPTFLGAQSLQVGNTILTPNSSDVPLAVVRTDIDLARPATASGVVDTASFQWSELGCLAEVEIKFFRRQGDTLVFLEERGPFDVVAAPTPVSLVPPVAVQEGDLIGITRLADCGGPSTLTGLVSPGYVGYSGDLHGNVSLAAAESTSPDELAVFATGTASETFTRLIAAVASTPGDHGSFFRTGIQIYNPTSSDSSGRFVYHPQGVAGASTDPSLTFTVGAGQTVSYPDIVATLGTTGKGSLDVVLPVAAQVPIIVTRVFNDAGAAGTSGFTEDPINPDDTSPDGPVLFAGATGFLIAPADATRFRFNIGVRSLLSGASLTFRVHDATGAVIQTTTKNYPATFFEQQPSNTYLGVSLGPNDTVEVSVSAGSAVVYGATTDNATNDPSIQFARVIFAIL